MHFHSRAAILFRVVLLPLALIGGTVAGLGSYYEASDDATLGWMFAGVLALKPVTSLPLYFHGYGHALAAAYGAAPGVPWFGLLLGLTLTAATVLAFAVVDRLLRPHLRPSALVLVLIGLFFVAWLEHWLWFSYVRGALLLAGLAVLFAAQRPGRRGALAIGAMGLLAAWLMRPGLGVLGWAAAIPAAIWLAGSWRRTAPVLVGGAALLALATGVAALRQTPAEAHVQVRDTYFARILDFDLLRPQPRTAVDSLGTAAVGLWLLGDSAVVNDGLLRRAYGFDAQNFGRQELPAKLGLRAGLLLRDYFPLLLALAATGLLARRRAGRGWFWLVQLGFAGVLVLFAGVFKLPPRLALPLLDFWLLTNAAFLWGQESPAMASEMKAGGSLALRRLGVATALVAGLVYAFKTGHRYRVLRQERLSHEQTLQGIARAGAGRVRVLAGTNDLLKSLSPFRSYTLGPGSQLLLTGWTSHDASQAGLRRALSGSTDQTTCLRHLAAGPSGGVLWVLSPAAAAWLNRRFALGGQGWPVHLAPGAASLLPDSTVRIYRARTGYRP